MNGQKTFRSSSALGFGTFLSTIALFLSVVLLTGNRIPGWGVTVAVIVIVCISILVGVVVANRREIHQNWPEESTPEVSEALDD